LSVPLLNLRQRVSRRAELIPSSAFVRHRLHGGLATPAGGCARITSKAALLCFQQRLDLLLNLHEPGVAIHVDFLSRMAGVLAVPVFSVCLLNSLDLILQPFDFLGNRVGA
jgi:hypothetical protein